MLSFWEPRSPPSLFHSRPADEHSLSEPQQEGLLPGVLEFGLLLTLHVYIRLSYWAE